MAKLIQYDQHTLAQTAHFNVNLLAQQCHVSPRQMQRDFRKHMACTPREWLDNHRIICAKSMLASGIPVKKVALDLGFKQISHFCRKFKQLSGITASEYKKQSFPSPRDIICR
jgi:transcriptional regulator GlxA family with amidase domain